MKVTNTQTCLEILRAIDLEDSALFGLSIDYFKIRMLISAGMSSRLEDFGFNPIVEDLCFDFRLLGGTGFDVRLSHSVHGPTYSKDGEMLALHLMHFAGESLAIQERGRTSLTERNGVWREPVPVYEIDIPLRSGSVRFQFCEVRASIFSADEIDCFAK